MRLTLTLFLLAVSQSLSSARTRQHTSIILNSTVQSIDQPDYTQSRKSKDYERDINRVQIHNQIGLDGKVRRIHLDSDEEDKPGIRAFGLPKKRLQDNGIIEKLHLRDVHRIHDTSRSGRLVEAYGMPKINVETNGNMETNGFIERLPLSSTGQQPAKLGLENESVRTRRYVSTENGMVEGEIANEAEDMQAQDTKVFRPLFVYRQQVAAKERRKHARNAVYRNHRHVTRQPCSRQRVTY